MARLLERSVDVVDKMLWLLNREAKSFRGAEAEAESMKLDLRILRATIAVSYRPRLAVEISGFKELKELWERVKFVLDTYLQNLEQLQQQQQRPKRPVLKFLGKDTVEEIHEMYAKLETKYSQGSGRSTSLLANVPRVFLEELVGIKSQKEDLVSMLVGESSTATRSVISLVGIAGVGKTTLASVVYQSEDVQQHFDCHAWINVSQCYDFDILFRNITELICPYGDCLDGEIDTVEELISRLNRYLMKKRYVIVLDDVWQKDYFQAMNDVFPDNNKGSRIIITTRNDVIAAACDNVQTIQPLSEEMALKLFNISELIWSHDTGDQHELKMLSLEALRSCKGLPLVIWVLGDLMTKRRSVMRVSKWQVQLRNFKDEIGKGPSQVEEVCRVFYHNYDELPFRNKLCFLYSFRNRLCFLYFGIFPKDYLIPDVKLVKLWIAEGFVKEEMGKTLEQVAETYLKDLINRNLVQVSCINYDGTGRMCRVHGFMHQIISSAAKRYQIFEFLRETRTKMFLNYVTRCFYGDTISSSEMTSEQPNASTVFLSDVNQMRKSFVVNLDERFKLLVLLDFENAPLDDLPKEIGKLSFLKYLSLRNTKVKKLPKYMGRLINLQTLDIRNTLMQELPIQIQKLRKLRHLMASAHYNQGNLDSVHGVQIKEGIGCLENLQTLMTVEAHRSALVVIEELEKLRQLRCLSISKLTADMVSTLCSFIEKMNLLESLSLYLSTDSETFDLESISSPPPLLRRLVLKGRLEKLPDWILGLQNLSILGLSFSKLVVDPLKALQCLPNLKFLWLHRAYEGELLHFEGISFQKLKQLVLTEFHYLRMVRIERGALPMLEELRIGPCQNDLSFDIQNLKNLQLLEFYDMFDEFVLRLQPEGGSDYWKVKHVPSVVFRYRISGSRCVSYKLGEPDLLNRLKRLVRTTSNVELYGRQLSFFYNDDEEVARTSNAEWSDQYSNFTNDVEY